MTEAENSRMLDLALFFAGSEMHRLTDRCPFEVHGYPCGADEPCEDKTDAPECWNAYWRNQARIAWKIGVEES